MVEIFNKLLNVSNKVVRLFNGDMSLSDVSTIDRSVVDPEVRLGSLYDAREDTIIDYGDVKIKSNTRYVQKKPTCRMFPGSVIKREKLLQIIEIDDETRLSITLKMVKPKGILSVIDYSFPIDNLTRLIYYFHQSRNESFAENLSENKNFFQQLIPSCLFTHIVTKIKWGIGVVIILQLNPVDQSLIMGIDDFLNHLCSQLNNQSEIYSITPNEEKLLEDINLTKLYSNMDAFAHLNNIYHICQHIQKVKQNPNTHRSLNFKMYPIYRLCYQSDLIKNTFQPMDTRFLNDIESYLLPLSFQLEILRKMIDEYLLQFLHDHLRQQIDYVTKKLSDLRDYYLTEVKMFRDMVVRIRGGENLQNDLCHLLNLKEQRSLETELGDLKFHLEDLKVKKDLVIYFQKEQIDYSNVENSNINQDDDQLTLEHKLIKNNENIRVFCSNDYLRQSNINQWNEKLSELIGERMTDEKLHLVYADFSYSSFHLKEIKILKLKKQQITTEISLNIPKTSRKDDSIINILLFGESGVGKSTFINAFANYLQFQTIDQARSREPIVVIPVSFSMAINDQFEEKLIQFGYLDSNENHNDLGQSVTQQCKSYEFNNRNGKTLKIIDTPGFGDTRGQDQDDTNLNQIISFIENLSHLNALCILLKSNVKQLTPSFRSSLTQILDHLGVHFHKNIFFCFTNSQSTFFSVGDTGPVLNKFLQTHQNKQIHLKKENTFCFDSESFRYLVASQHSIKFDEHYIHQFEQSWLRSVEESNRLVNHICLQEKQHKIDHKWISIEQIKREINLLIRPMLKTIRNILSTDKNLIDKTANYSSEDANCYLYEIIKASIDFDCLLNDNEPTNKDRPFISGINRMINEVESIFKQDQSNRLNEKPRVRLEKLKEQYYKELKGINSVNKNEILKRITSRIEGMKNMPMIYEQLNTT